MPIRKGIMAVSSYQCDVCMTVSLCHYASYLKVSMPVRISTCFTLSKGAVMVFSKNSVEGGWKWGEHKLPKVSNYS